MDRPGTKQQAVKSRSSSVMRLLTLVAAWALGFAWLIHPDRLRGWYAEGLVWSIWAAVAWATFDVVRGEGRRGFGRGMRLVLDAAVAVSVTTTLYVIWAYQRVRWWDWGQTEYGFPHPDALILILLRHYEWLYPVRDPDLIKILGEFPRVAATFAVAILPLLAISGILLGLRFPGKAGRADRRLVQPAGGTGSAWFRSYRERAR